MLRFCLQTYRFEQFVNVISNEQGVSQNAYDLNNRPSDFMLVLNDSDETVCDDGNMDLYAYGIFTLTPKSLDSEMLLDPFEEKFDLPAVPVEKCNLRSLEIEVVRVVRERPAEVWSIIDNPSDCGRIIADISLAGKADSLVSNDISEIVGLGDDIPVGSSSSETEMIGAFSMGANKHPMFDSGAKVCISKAGQHIVELNRCA